VPEMNKKKFDAARLALADRLRRDASKTPSARIVGADIIARTNFVTGDSWASEATLAKDLGLTVRTVKRGIHDIRGDYLIVEKRGRSNRYRPKFALLTEPELPLAGGVSSAGVSPPSHEGQILWLAPKSQPQ
jgi:hypothetical protein